jgi:hypothetical protein
MVTLRRGVHARGQDHTASRTRRPSPWGAPALLALLVPLMSAPGQGLALAPPTTQLVVRAPALPPYYIEALRARRYPSGALALGNVLARGTNFTT